MINLLPRQIRDRHKIAKRVVSIAVAYGIVLLLLIGGAAGLAIYNNQVKSAVADKQAKLTALNNQRQDVAALVSEAGFIENRLKSASKYTESNDWGGLLTLIANDTPNDTVIKSAKLSVDQNQSNATPLASLSGQSLDRRNIILFKEKLASEKQLSNVTIQSMNDSKNSDGSKIIAFTLTFNLQNASK